MMSCRPRDRIRCSKPTLHRCPRKDGSSCARSATPTSRADFSMLFSGAEGSAMTSPDPVPTPAHAAPPRRASRSPWLFVPTLYFAEGVPYILVNTVSVILYKRLGVANHTITFWTSLLYLPWVIKMLWGPLVDTRGTKRAWILITQLLMTVSLAGLALSLGLPGYFAVTLGVFTLAAFISATHDIAADGFYLYALNERQQAYFVGVRTLFYRAAMIFGSGLLVTFAGTLEQRQ